MQNYHEPPTELSAKALDFSHTYESEYRYCSY